MLIFDCHADTLGKWTDGAENTHFSFDEIKGKFVQTFAAFIGTKEDPWKRVNNLIDTYDALSQTKKIESLSDLDNMDKSEDGIYSVLSVEGADFITDGTERLFSLFSRGVRMLTLVWNNENALCGAAVGTDNGLKEPGARVIKAAEELGITLDLSHMGDKSFYDCMSVVKKPVVASHSNSRTICPVKRNITDDEFMCIKRNGGCVGINFYPEFLADKKATVDDIIRHIDYFLSLGGEDNIGIGTDFDGIGSLPEGISSTASLYTLCEKLNGLYGDIVTEKIMGKNFLRVLRTNLR